MFVCPECGRPSEAAGFCPMDGTRLAERGDDALIGETIGSYRIARLLGVGGMGRVYKAVHPDIGSRVAIKVLSRECADSPELIERFFAEARAVNVIRHENIVNILDLARLRDGRPYIVLEYLDGAPLSEIIRTRGPLPLGSVARLAAEVLAALGAAHQAGIVHRDLKPDNIFVSPQGRAKVLDFGIAKLMPELSGTPGPTRTGSLLGTPHYMSPEQAMGRPVDARTDVYAVGIILFECVTGRRPFIGDSLYELLHKQVDEAPPRPSMLRPDIPAVYEEIILRTLAKDPNARFQSVLELAQALGYAVHGLPADAWAPVGPGSQPLVSMGPPSVLTPVGLMASPTPVPPAHHTPLPNAATGAYGSGNAATGAYGSGNAATGPYGAAGMAMPTPVAHGPGRDTPTTTSSGQLTPYRNAGAGAGSPRRGLLVAAAIIGIAGAAAIAVVVTQRGQDDQGQSPEEGTGVSDRQAASGASGTESGDRGATTGTPPGDSDDDDDDDEIATGDLEKVLEAASALGEGADQGEYAEYVQAMQALQALQAGGAAEDVAEARELLAEAMAAAKELGIETPAMQIGDDGKLKYILPGTYQPSGFRPNRFDVSGFVDEAWAKAKEHYSDAQLVRIDASGVYPDGHADLTLSDSVYVIYHFNSPSRGKRPANLPLGVEHKPNCKIQIWVTAEGVRANPLDGWACDEPVIGMPRCSLKDVWQRAAKSGAPRDNAVATMGYYAWDGDKRWYITIGDVFSDWAHDTCD